MRAYTWLGYPILVAVTVVMSLRLVGQAEIWENQRQAAANAAQAALLRHKLKLIEAVTLPSLEADMQQLLAALPAGNPTPLLLLHIDAAASTSGAAVVGFRSSQQELTVSLGVADLASVMGFLQYLNQALPLVKMTEVTFAPGVAEVTLVAGYQPLPPVAAQVAAPLTDPRTEVEKIKAQIAAFKAVQIIPASQSEASASATGSPFGSAR